MSDSDWVEWSGGELPGDRNSLVFVRFRNHDRETEKPKAKHRYHWHHNGGGGDIIAYRLAHNSAEED
jgi:hypothetical protein